MSKKLLVNASTPTIDSNCVDSNCVATIVTGYPIVINNENLCLECGATIESIVAEGNIGVLNENGVYEIVIIASNAPYIQDTKSDIYTPRDSIVFYDYKDSRTIITLPQQLNSGDMLVWNDSLRRYVIKKADSRVIEIDTDVKYVLDVVGPYYRIETDEKESAPASMTVKLYISKDVL